MVLLGIMCMHVKEIVHCDLKPENIFLVEPEDGVYTVMVHYYEGTSMPLPEVEVWVDNTLVSWVLYGAALPYFSQKYAFR